MCTTYDVSFSSRFPSSNRNQFPPDNRANKCPRLEDVEICTHLGFLKILCLDCGQNLDNYNTLISIYNSTISLHYVYEDMRFSRDKIDGVKIKDTNIMLGQNKHYLILDLDQTLLHSVRVQDLDQDKFTDFLDRAENSLRGELFYVEAIGTMTKLRPLVRAFLEEANTMFKMYIYTWGEHIYAKVMANLLDPDGVYFGSQIISKENCTMLYQKGLDVVLGLEGAVVILDDQEKVWPFHRGNLMIVDKYCYFYHDQELGCESDGVLGSIVEVLKQVHTKFFEECDKEKLLERDGRKIMEEFTPQS